MSLDRRALLFAEITRLFLTPGPHGVHTHLTGTQLTLCLVHCQTLLLLHRVTLLSQHCVTAPGRSDDGNIKTLCNLLKGANLFLDFLALFHRDRIADIFGNIFAVASLVALLLVNSFALFLIDLMANIFLFGVTYLSWDLNTLFVVADLNVGLTHILWYISTLDLLYRGTHL